MPESLSATTRTLSVPDTDELGFGDASTAAATERFVLVVFCRKEADLAPLSPSRPVVVGRRAPSEILLDDPAVSRQHARFSVRDGEVFVEDLGSRNGTLLDGRRITARERVNPGDRVQLGPAVVVLAASRGATAQRAFDEVVIRNRTMQELYRVAERAAASTAPVLILGETGTGKEHLAKTLHARGPRRTGPFVAVNCGAIPGSLTESVLFGHERGAFTGAASRSEGVFEQASGGVLFLDEIGEMQLTAQAALLRALETKQIRRVGGNRDIAIDARVVAATHCDIAKMIEDGTFREDLYYRLSMLVLNVPPLRERRDEIEPLAEQFLTEARSAWGTGPEHFSAGTLRRLEAYEWPGNVRQLRHLVQRAVLLGQTESIELPEAAGPSPEPPAPAPTESAGLRDALEVYEARLIQRALERARGNREAAAKLLRLPVRTLFRKLRQHGISDRPDRAVH